MFLPVSLYQMCGDASRCAGSLSDPALLRRRLTDRGNCRLHTARILTAGRRADPFGMMIADRVEAHYGLVSSLNGPHENLCSANPVTNPPSAILADRSFRCGAACLNVSSPRTVRLDRDGATGLIRWPHHLPDRSGAISQAIRRTHAGGRAWRAVDLGQNRARQSGGWHDSVVPAGAGAGRSPDLRRPDNRQGRTFWRHLAAHPGVRRRPWRHGSARTSGPAATALRSLPLTWCCPVSPPCRRQSS